MKKFLTFILAIATVVLSASTCEKLEPGDYLDFTGAKINLFGSWVLTEVQYKTAGVIESHASEPVSVMVFAANGIGHTRNMAGEILESWHYETDTLHEQISGLFHLPPVRESDGFGSVPAAHGLEPPVLHNAMVLRFIDNVVRVFLSFMTFFV